MSYRNNVARNLSSPPLLAFKNLKVSGAKQKQILSGIDLHVYPKEMLAIIGPNGAGKSTLIKAILNLIPYQAELACIDGQCASQLKDISRAKILSYVPQFVDLMNDVTVYQWCEMARFSHQRHGFYLSANDKAAINYAIQACQLEDLQSIPLQNLSGGQRQRAFIAGALAQESKVILLDEPTSHLDPAHAVDILSLLKRLNQTCHQTIICVSHDINQVYQYFDQVLALKSGEMLFYGQTDIEINLDALYKLYGQTFLMMPHGSTQFFMPNMRARDQEVRKTDAL